MPAPSAAFLAEAFFHFKKKASDGVCWVKGCRNPSRNDRCLCHKHEMRRWRAKQKLTADFCTLRDHAKARGIEFSITVDYWRGLTDAFGFYEAREDEVLTVDRVDPTKGYVEGNLRVVTLSLNASRANRMRYLPEVVQEILQRKRGEIQAEHKTLLSYDYSAECGGTCCGTKSEYYEDDDKDPF